MLLILASAGLGAGQAEVSARYRAERDREAELLFRGGEFVRAIRSFYLAEPDPKKRRLPRDFGELERDPRGAAVRHIRRLYADPLTGDEFRPLMGADANGSGVVGVASASDKVLMKRADLGPDLPFTEGVERAAQLRFEIDLKALVADAKATLSQGRQAVGRP